MHIIQVYVYILVSESDEWLLIVRCNFVVQVFLLLVPSYAYPCGSGLVTYGQLQGMKKSTWLRGRGAWKSQYGIPDGMVGLFLVGVLSWRLVVCQYFFLRLVCGVVPLVVCHYCLRFQISILYFIFS